MIFERFALFELPYSIINCGRLHGHKGLLLIVRADKIVRAKTGKVMPYSSIAQTSINWMNLFAFALFAMFQYFLFLLLYWFYFLHDRAASRHSRRYAALRQRSVSFQDSCSCGVLLPLRTKRANEYRQCKQPYDSSFCIYSADIVQWWNALPGNEVDQQCPGQQTRPIQ